MQRTVGATNYPPVVVWSEKDLSKHLLSRVNENLYLFNFNEYNQYVVEHSNATVLHVDGFGVYDDFPVGCSHDFRQLHGKHNVITPNDYAEKMRGSVVTYLYDQINNSVKLLPDVLGGGIVFIYDKNGIVAASSSLRTLVKCLNLLGCSLTKSTGYFLESLAVGSGIVYESPYEEISSLSFLKYIEFFKDTFRVATYSIANEFFETDLNYEEEVTYVLNEICKNVAALARVDGIKISQLTAGADSRMNAAALVHEGIADQFKFYTGGPHDSIERKVAGQVCSHLGLTTTNDPGQISALEYADITMQPLHILNSTEGIKDIGPHEGFIQRPGVVLLGNHGEFMRSYYSSRFKDGIIRDGRTFLHTIFPPILYDEKYKPIISDKIIADYVLKVDQEIEKARSMGVREDAIGDYLFVAGRNRYFVSHTSMEVSRYINMFGPLYSWRMARLGLALPIQERDDGIFMYDVFRALSEKALEIPFDVPKFGESVYASSEPIQQVDPNTLGEPDNDNIDLPEPLKIDYNRWAGFEVNRSHIETAQRIRLVKPIHVAVAEESRSELRALVNKKRDLSQEWFKVDNLNRLLRGSFNIRQKIRVVYALSTYLNWYYKDA